MNLKFAAVSVMALTLFMGPVLAEDAPSADQPATDQPAADQPAVEKPVEAAAPAAVPDDVLALLNDRRSAQELSDDELKGRAKQARRAMKTDGLPEDVKGQLQAMMDADRAELESRVAAQKPAEQPAQAAEPPVKKKKAEPEQQAQPEAAPATAEIPAEVTDLLNDKRGLDALTDEELGARAKLARQQSKNEALPEDVRGTLADIGKAARQALAAREQAAAQKKAEPLAQPEPVTPKQAEQPAPAVEIPADVTALLNDTQPVDALTDEQLGARAKFARQQSKNDALPEDVRVRLADIGKQARQAMLLREQALTKKKDEATAQPEPVAPKQAEQPPQPDAAVVVTEPPPETKAVETAPPPAPPAPPIPDKAQVQQLDGNVGDPVAEKKARAFLDDATPAESLNDEALRARLDGIRDLMAENELSIKTERALRQKLAAERVVLRDRMAKVKADEEAKLAATKSEEDKKRAQAAADAGQPEPKKDRKPNINIIITADTPLQEILRDRRDPQNIDESELRYRIRARRDFEASDQFREYDDQHRQQWRETTRRDREYLRGQLEEDRNIRRVELDRPANIRRIVIDDNRRYADQGDPEEVFAAEVDDTELERVLLAPPRKKITRKISVNDIASQPQARKAMTRIDVDTIRFGFNEAFVREEEVANLDQIASVMERVLKKYPREVFLIEGHTDAVGSDAYNDRLSKARAEAVKKALTTYYVIPQKNLQTVGLGERYLKIPTAEAEQENRRVSISRATAVIGEAE